MKKGITYSSIDFEGTGGNIFFNGGIVEVGAIHFNSEGINQKIFHSLINPGISIPDKNIAIHGIKNVDVEKAPFFIDIRQDLAEFINGTFVVAHKADNEAKILNVNLHKFEPLGILDTYKLCKTLFPDLKRYSLDYLIDFFSLDVFAAVHMENQRGWHSALFDAYATAHLYMHLSKIATERFDNTKTAEDISSLER